MPLHARRDVEGPSSGVHAGRILRVGDLLQDDLDLVKPASVVHMLPDELDGRLRVILVHEGHVHVIHKVHQPPRSRGPKSHTCNSRKQGLKFALQWRVWSLHKAQ